MTSPAINLFNNTDVFMKHLNNADCVAVATDLEFPGIFNVTTTIVVDEAQREIRLFATKLTVTTAIANQLNTNDSLNVTVNGTTSAYVVTDKQLIEDGLFTELTLSRGNVG